MPADGIAKAVLFCCLLTVAAVTDIRQREIPPVLPLGILLTSLIGFRPEMLLGLLPVIAFLIAANLSPGSIGGGDIKLIAACGLVLGNTRCVIGLSTALVLLELYHLTRRKRKQFYPLAPFFAIGFITAYFINFGGICI